MTDDLGTTLLVRMVDIKDIDRGERRREEFGEIARLAESFEKYGQRHPITLTTGNRLVDGGRRIKAAEFLKWQQIDATYLNELSEEGLRDLELEATDTAKLFTEQERTKRMIEKAVEEIEAEKAQGSFAPPMGQNSKTVSKRGRKGEGKPKSKKATTREIAKKTGLSKSEVGREQQHSKAIEKYPILEQVYESRRSIIEAAQKIDPLNKEHREEVVESLKAGQKLSRILERIKRRKGNKPTKPAEGPRGGSVTSLEEHRQRGSEVSPNGHAEETHYYDKTLEERAAIDVDRWLEFIEELETVKLEHGMELTALVNTGDGIHPKLADTLTEEEIELYQGKAAALRSFAVKIKEFAEASQSVLGAALRERS